MSILENTKIGNSVKVNLELSKDRLTKEMFDTINISPVGEICDFKITDGKGIGVVLKFSNGKEQWFFEDEIDLLDENGQVIKKIKSAEENVILTFETLKSFKYENKNTIRELVNPINFFLWLVVSLKDIF
jgi:hypothetical protein